MEVVQPLCIIPLVALTLLGSTDLLCPHLRIKLIKMSLVTGANTQGTGFVDPLMKFNNSMFQDIQAMYLGSSVKIYFLNHMLDAVLQLLSKST
jgi:hypothetical protein